MPSSRGWAYVDDRRTHEVRVSFEHGRTLDMVVQECAFGGAPAEEVHVERHRMSDPWDEKLHTLALETRLTLLGNYHKSGPTGWTPVRLAQAGRAIDLRPLDIEHGNAVEFHHFLGPKNAAASLVAVHTETDRGRRSLLVRLDYDFPNTEGGKLEVIHAKLPPILYRSVLAGQHLALAEKRFHKTAPDHRKIASSREWAALRATLDAILSRLVVSADAKADALLDASGRTLDAKALAILAEAARSIKGAASADRQYSVEQEIDGEATKVAGKAPEVMMEALSPDVFAALNEPKLLALHARFMPAPHAEAELFAKGERAILAHARKLRDLVRPDEYHLVSLLEASLLLRYALKNRTSVDPDVIKRVKHARAYL